MTAAIETTQLTKSFGELTAVDALDLVVESGSVFGFIGPNGAGKSTTIRMLLDAVRPSHGRAQILGLDCHDDMLRVHRRLGYVPADLQLPHDMDGSDYLDFLAEMRGLTDRRFRDELSERLRFDPTRKLSELSTGNKRKIALVQAFMHHPDIVLLDEPTSGIDPLIQHEFHDILAEYASTGGTVFLSSHTLSEVERVADTVGIIRSGQLITVDTVAALRRQAHHELEIEFAPITDVVALDTAVQHIAQIPGVGKVEQREHTLVITHAGDIDPILRKALDIGPVASLRATDPDLEDVFLRYYQTEVADT